MTGPGFTLEFVAHDWERFAEAAELRYGVLHDPFGVVRDDEWHDDDPASEHIVAIANDGPVVGYARLITHDSEAQIRQVAVAFDWQRSGVGSALVAALVSQALENGARAVWLNARVPAIGFYERLGFEALGEVFATGKTGLPHRRMEYRGFGE
jgi:predicted GNAT family N-acyltransferase